MKVTDIKRIPPPNSSYLEEMYNLQKELIKPYIGIEGLPEYPLDVDTKANQALLKDFISRIIEELGEAFQEFEKLYILALGGFENKLDAQQILSNFNEEIADALHFFLELLIYLNIGPQDLDSYAQHIMGDINLNLEEEPLDNLLKISRHHNNTIGRNIYKAQSGYYVDVTGEDGFTIAGRKVGSEQIINYKVMLWETTYTLQLVRNELKNKPWTQTGTLTNTEVLQEKAVQSFLTFMMWLEYTGHTSQSIYTVYYKKNQVNQQRIKDKR